MKIVLLVALGACTADPSITNALPSDGYFTGFGAQFASPEDCVAQNPNPNIQSCTFEIALCRDGNAGMRIGDVISEGVYRMDGPRAIASGSGTDFELDVDSGVGTGLADGLRWEPDTAKRWQTMQWDVIGCTTPAF